MREALPKAIHRLNLREYFEHFANHKDNISLEMFKNIKNAAYFYCSLYTPSKVMVKVVKKVTVNPELFKVNSIETDNIFFDDLGITIQDDFMVSDSGEPAVAIYVGHRIAGYYFIERNVLFATDWTHDAITVGMFAKVWEEFVKEVEVKKVGEEERKKEQVDTNLKIANLKVTVTVGADPEFEVLDCTTGNLVPAYSFIRDDSHNKKIGCDGAGTQLELRPKAGTPVEVIRDIKRLITRFHRLYPDKNIVPDGDTVPVGGHIHIGFEADWYEVIEQLRDLGIMDEIIELFDDFIGKKTIELSGSARCHYKRLGAYEVKPWGFEYRTPPALIFATPEIARIHLKIAKNIVENFIKNEEITYNDPPTAEDYMRIAGLTEKEYKKFMDFVNNPTKYKKSIVTAWTGKRIQIPTLQEWNYNKRLNLYDDSKLIYYNTY